MQKLPLTLCLQIYYALAELEILDTGHFHPRPIKLDIFRFGLTMPLVLCCRNFPSSLHSATGGRVEGVNWSPPLANCGRASPQLSSSMALLVAGYLPDCRTHPERILKVTHGSSTTIDKLLSGKARCLCQVVIVTNKLEWHQTNCLL